MMNLSNYVDGKDGKELSRLISEYEDISLKIKDLETEKKEVLAKIYNLSVIGTNETDKVVFNLFQMEGRESVSLAEIKKHDGYLYEKLDDGGYINYGEPYKVIRSIKHKGKRV